MSETSSTGRMPKGRPTPKRSEARGGRTGPVAPPPRSRREAAKRQREQNADRRRAGKGTSAAGERPLLARDSGPVRRAVRDLVDRRRSPATLLLPAAVLPLLGNVSGNPAVVRVCTALWVVALAVAVADFTSVAARTRRMLKTDFPDDRGRGHVMYAVLRTLQFRRFRLPKPQAGPPPLRRP